MAEHENPQKMKQINTSSLQQKSKQHNHQHQHDLDDGCQNCVKEKQENEKLVDFYQRLNSITGKVATIKNTYGNHKKQLQVSSISQIKKKESEQQNQKSLNSKVNAINDVNLKEMGFQLAAALIQRQLKIKQQNQRLQSIIDKLIAQKNQSYSNNLSFHHYTNENFSNFGQQNVITGHNTQFRQKSMYDDNFADSLDFLEQKTPETLYKKTNTNKKSQQTDYWNIGLPTQNNKSQIHKQNKLNKSYEASTFFSTIDNKKTLNTTQTNSKISEVKQKKSFQSMNLWLYKVESQKYNDSRFPNYDFLPQTVNDTKFSQKTNKKDNIKNQKQGSPRSTLLKTYKDVNNPIKGINYKK